MSNKHCVVGYYFSVQDILDASENELAGVLIGTVLSKKEFPEFFLEDLNYALGK